MSSDDFELWPSGIKELLVHFVLRHDEQGILALDALEEDIPGAGAAFGVDLDLALLGENSQGPGVVVPTGNEDLRLGRHGASAAVVPAELAAARGFRKTKRFGGQQVCLVMIA